MTASRSLSPPLAATFALALLFAAPRELRAEEGTLVAADGPVEPRVPPACERSAAGRTPEPRRLWGTFFNGKGCRPLVLLAPRLAWIDTERPLPEQVCNEDGVCARIVRSSGAYRPACPTCTAPVLYQQSLLALDRDLGDAPPLAVEPGKNPAQSWMTSSPPAAPEEEAIAWGETQGQTREWSLEVAAEPTVMIGQRRAAGISGRAGFRHFDDYSSHSPLDDMGLAGVFVAMVTLGIVAVPGDVWLGNDAGLDLRAHLLVEPEARLAPTWAVGLAPALRVVPGSGRVRYPSILGVLLPEAGITVHDRGVGPEVQPYLLVLRAPFGGWIDDHTGLDLEPGVWLGDLPGGRRGVFADATLAITLSVVAR